MAWSCSTSVGSEEDYPLVDPQVLSTQPSTDFQWAATVASFGMLLRDSMYRGESSFERVLEAAIRSKGPDKSGRRAEFIKANAKELTRKI